MGYYYVDGITSSGKSVLLRTLAFEKSQSGINTIIALPTIALIDEYQIRFQADYPGMRVEPFYTGDERPNKTGAVGVDVKGEIQTTLPDEGRTIIVTHSTFTNLKLDSQLSHWNVLIDEELRVFNAEELSIHHSNNLLTDHLDVEPVGPRYGRVTIENKDPIKALLDNREQDATWDVFKNASRNLLSPWMSNYTILTSYNDLKNARGKKRKLFLFSALQASIAGQYAAVTVFCARFSETLHYKMWEWEGVEWKRDDDLCDQLRIQRHEGYHRLKIYYGYDGHFSKRLRDVQSEMFIRYQSEAKKLIGGKDFLFLVNNDIKGSCDLVAIDGSKGMKGQSCGLNEYDSYDHIIVGAAYNMTPAAGKFLSEFYHIDESSRKTAGVKQKLYQAVSRTSMRSGVPEKERIWVVPDRSVAEWLSGIMVGSSVFSLNLEQPPARTRGRPPQYEDSNQRKNQSKKSLRNSRKQVKSFIPEIAPEMISSMSVHFESDGDINTIRSISDFVATYRGTIFPDMYHNRGECLFLDGRGFISYLKKQSKIQYINKHDVPLISPAFWNPCYNGEKPRGKHNAVCSNGFMMDVDGGEMRPEDLSNLFPHLRLYVYSTFNHTKEEQRYRVYIPSTRPTTIPEYRAILETLVYAIESQGYMHKGQFLAKPRVSANTRLHGIDRSKLGAFSLFYLPCQPENGSKSFFKSFEGPGRTPLDVNDWLNTLPPGIHIQDNVADRPVYHEPPTDEINPEQRAGIAKAMDRWIQQGALPRNGYQGICDLFSDLCRLELTRSVIEWHLLNAATFANSPRDRKKQVEGLMKTWITKRKS